MAKATIVEPIASFKIKPRPRSKLWFVVNVWETLEQMWNHCSWVPHHPPYDALCSSHDIFRFEKGKTIFSGELGELNFVKDRVYTEIIAHEVAHATFAYLRRLKISFADMAERGRGGVMSNRCSEERYCYANGWMTRELVDKLWKHGLLK